MADRPPGNWDRPPGIFDDPVPPVGPAELQGAWGSLDAPPAPPPPPAPGTNPYESQRYPPNNFEVASGWAEPDRGWSNGTRQQQQQAASGWTPTRPDDPGWQATSTGTSAPQPSQPVSSVGSAWGGEQQKQAGAAAAAGAAAQPARHRRRRHVHRRRRHTAASASRSSSPRAAEVDAVHSSGSSSRSSSSSSKASAAPGAGAGSGGGTGNVVLKPGPGKARSTPPTSSLARVALLSKAAAEAKAKAQELTAQAERAARNMRSESMSSSSSSSSSVVQAVPVSASASGPPSLNSTAARLTAAKNTGAAAAAPNGTSASQARKKSGIVVRLHNDEAAGQPGVAQSDPYMLPEEEQDPAESSDGSSSDGDDDDEEQVPEDPAMTQYKAKLAAAEKAVPRQQRETLIQAWAAIAAAEVVAKAPPTEGETEGDSEHVRKTAAAARREQVYKDLEQDLGLAGADKTRLAELKRLSMELAKMDASRDAAAKTATQRRLLALSQEQEASRRRLEAAVEAALAQDLSAQQIEEEHKERLRLLSEKPDEPLTGVTRAAFAAQAAIVKHKLNLESICHKLERIYEECKAPGACDREPVVYSGFVGAWNAAKALMVVQRSLEGMDPLTGGTTVQSEDADGDEGGKQAQQVLADGENSESEESGSRSDGSPVVVAEPVPHVPPPPRPAKSLLTGVQEINSNSASPAAPSRPKGKLPVVSGAPAAGAGYSRSNMVAVKAPPLDQEDEDEEEEEEEEEEEGGDDVAAEVVDSDRVENASDSDADAAGAESVDSEEDEEEEDEDDEGETKDQAEPGQEISGDSESPGTTRIRKRRRHTARPTRAVLKPPSAASEAAAASRRERHQREDEEDEKKERELRQQLRQQRQRRRQGSGGGGGGEGPPRRRAGQGQGRGQGQRSRSRSRRRRAARSRSREGGGKNIGRGSTRGGTSDRRWKESDRNRSDNRSARTHEDDRRPPWRNGDQTRGDHGSYRSRRDSEQGRGGRANTGPGHGRARSEGGDRGGRGGGGRATLIRRDQRGQYHR